MFTPLFFPIVLYPFSLSFAELDIYGNNNLTGEKREEDLIEVEKVLKISNNSDYLFFII